MAPKKNNNDKTKNGRTRKKRTIELIQNGTVIDHIDPEALFRIVRILRIDESSDQVTVGNNLRSRYHGRKGIIKVENVFLTEEDVNKVSVISPHVTMNIIRDYEVVQKFLSKLPPKIEGIIKCFNPNCITNVENVRPRFTVENEDPLELFCNYCERTMHRDDVEVRSIRR